MTGFVDRVAVEALQVRPLKAFLTLIALPFYVLGWIVGLLWLAVRFIYGAVKVGIADAQARAARPVPAVPSDDGEGT